MCSSIPYSSKAFRWYPGNNDHTNKKKLNQITNWWEKLNGKNIYQCHITGIELNKSSGEWKITQQNTDQFTIQNPQLETDSTSQTIISFTKKGTPNKKIEVICLDFDPQQNFIIIYTANGIERYIFYTV